MIHTVAAMSTFAELELAPALLRALSELGYETPSPIQAATIPALLQGRDLLGQAQTGTGKTAAFALPILHRLDLKRTQTQALVLAPTRELALQVAEAFQRYAAHLPGFHVLPIYGGQSYEPQLRALRRGVHVVVGTPGRVVDHIKRGTLKLDALRTLVLDEGDEMLRMGFIEDIEWILGQVPAQRQIALFSATLPTPIKRIAKTHLRDPAEVTIASRTTTAANIRQRYWVVSGVNKLDALTRILEAESFDGMLVFARTKIATDDLATRLEARGFSAAALNGDLQQAARERIVAQFKSGKIDIVVATDIAARGLDVERVSHVINYDVPTDTESYVHRIGRTGRAGRSGEAILFIAPRERHLLKTIERATRQTIEPMALPTADAVQDRKATRFKQRIDEVLNTDHADLGHWRTLIERYAQERGVALADVAAVLALLVQGESAPRRVPEAAPEEAPRERSRPRSDAAPPRRKKARADDAAMETYRIEVGLDHGVKPANIVGAIANEAGLEASHIGRIDIRGDHSLVELPQGMPKTIFRELQKVWVLNRQLRISRHTGP